MADAVKVSLLKKHVAPPRPVVAAGVGAIEKLLAVELPRAADQLLELQVDIQLVNLDNLEKVGVLAALGENDLICPMSRAGSHTGIIVVDPSFLSALIEIQTLGKVTGAPANERPPTQTDVTVVSEILDRWLADMARAASELGIAEEMLTNGYTRDSGRLDLRAVELKLDPGEYRSLGVTMALGAEAKTGSLSFFAPRSSASEGNEIDATLGRQLRAHLLDAPVEMTAVLARAERSLTEVMSLSAGDIFPVLAEQLQSVRLEVDDGTLITTARLGQAGGKRAVRPSLQDIPQFEDSDVASQVIEKTQDDLSGGGTAAFPQIDIGLNSPQAPEPNLATADSVQSEVSSELPDPEPAGERDARKTAAASSSIQSPE